MARVSIEDCLLYIENRFALVSVASDRTRKLMDGAEPMIRSRNREAVTALREIAEGLVTADARGEVAEIAEIHTPSEQRPKVEGA